ncbi:hypothetical protein HaLaN_25678, partial [Haematococcus lacustris]
RLLAKLLRQVADTSVAHAGGSTADDHGVLKALKENKARLDRLEADLAARSTANSQLQHSLYVVRAHWGGLKRLLAKLLRQVADTSVGHAGVSTADDHGVLKALKESKVQEQLGGLMRDWEDVGNKSAFDAAAEQALGAGCTILEQALEQWQGRGKVASWTVSALS